MEKITSRKNKYISHLRSLGKDGAYRREQGEYLLDGIKLLGEALEKGAEIRSVLWKEQPLEQPGLEAARQYIADEDLFDYASPMKNSPGPLFTVALPAEPEPEKIDRALVLENVQDPGNVGTVIRTARALGVETVIMLGACADVYSPKCARATMGAIFSQRICHMSLEELRSLADRQALPLYAAALSREAKDLRCLDLRQALVCIGSEGQGLSKELIELCDGELIIPMKPGSESLNAGVAAALVMWEMVRGG